MAAAAVLFAVVVTVAAGRLGALDAGSQLSVAELLVRDGALSLDERPSTQWAAGPNGRFYQGNDVGNPILMLPAALAGRLLGRPYEPGVLPDEYTAALASASVSAIVALGLVALFATLRQWLGSPRIALTLTLLFLFGTMFGAYQKVGYEVVGATALTCVVLWLLARATARPTVRVRDVAAIASAVGVTALFRSSYAPFLATGVLASLLLLPSFGRLRLTAVFGTVTAAVALPTLAYNALRTGNPFLPLNGAVPSDGLGRPLLDGLEYNLISIRKGLLFAAPVSALVPALAVARYRRALATGAFGRCVALLLIAASAYVVFVAKVKLEDPATWGPRFLLPVTPILFLALCPMILAAWRSPRRALMVPLLCASVLAGSAPILTAWNDDLVEFRESPGKQSAWSTAAHRAVAAGIADGVLGDERYDGMFVPDRGVQAAAGQAFPDFWWRQAVARGTGPGVLAVLVLASVWLIALRLLVGARRDRLRPSPRSSARS